MREPPRSVKSARLQTGYAASHIAVASAIAEELAQTIIQTAANKNERMALERFVHICTG